MSQKVNNVFNLLIKARYSYFVRKIADFQTVWGLYCDGWATVGVDGANGIPFWPESEFANACADGKWQPYTPREIPLDDFMKKWLPGMLRDANSVVVFPTPSNRGCVMSPSKLLADIEVELSQYQ